MSSLQDSSPAVRTRSTENPTQQESGVSRVLDAAFLPVDNASVTFFRVAFGGLMAAWAWNYLASGRVTRLYVDPTFSLHLLWIRLVATMAG
jgi:hypothetical protein